MTQDSYHIQQWTYMVWYRQNTNDLKQDNDGQEDYIGIDFSLLQYRLSIAYIDSIMTRQKWS